MSYCTLLIYSGHISQQVHGLFHANQWWQAVIFMLNAQYIIIPILTQLNDKIAPPDFRVTIAHGHIIPGAIPYTVIGLRLQPGIDFSIKISR